MSFKVALECSGKHRFLQRALGAFSPGLCIKISFKLSPSSKLFSVCIMRIAVGQAVLKHEQINLFRLFVGVPSM